MYYCNKERAKNSKYANRKNKFEWTSKKKYKYLDNRLQSIVTGCYQIYTKYFLEELLIYTLFNEREK